MSKHDAQSYRKYRPLYPLATFQSLIEHLLKNQEAMAFQVLDLGCGTGQSSFSLRAALEENEVTHSLSAKTQIHAVDPDPEMILFGSQSDRSENLTQFQVAPAETLPFSDGFFNGVQILSAYHWFSQPQANFEILRVLQPGGILLIAEYQFPKSLKSPDLNAWIKEGFHKSWRFENQKKRGSLRDLTRELMAHPQISHSEFKKLPMTQILTPEALGGLLLSQARVIAGLSKWPDPDSRAQEISRIRKEIEKLMDHEEHEFEFSLSTLILKKTAFRDGIS